MVLVLYKYNSGLQRPKVRCAKVQVYMLAAGTPAGGGRAEIPANGGRADTPAGTALQLQGACILAPLIRVGPPGYFTVHISGLDQVSTPQLFYTYFYNHAHRLRLEKLLLI